MKKQLLLGTALLAAISAFPQQAGKKPARFVDLSQRISAKFAVEENSNAKLRPVTPGTTASANTEPTAEEAAALATMPPSTINWKLLCGSININGMLVNQSRPLQYNDNVNAITFVYRASASYNAVPAVPATAKSGVIITQVSSNGGATFDSTCIWADPTNWGRYPQGAVYNPVGNTNLTNAYIVGSGPTVSGSSFTGNWYASKKLNAFNATADAAPGAQQFLSFTLPSYPANQGPHGWSRQGFSSTDDGVVRSLALIQDDNTGLSTMRGVSVVKGVFNAGTFSWTTDSLVPSTILKTDGSRNISSINAQMAWNESGTVGYVAMMGAKAGATLSNKSTFQPIIYKTTNSGTSWSLLPGINFNAPAMAPILDHIAGLNTDTNTRVPFFVEMDLTVDANNMLHIGSIFKTGASSHIDSLSFFAQYTLAINPGENYDWKHVAGQHPYLYDFIGDGTAPFIVKTIDSLSTESAGASTGTDGFNDNPWAATGAAEPLKTDDVGPRLQLSRTPDGQYITYAFSESDTNFTNGGRKYNSQPNVKTRCMAIGSGTNMYQVSPTEINVTKVLAGTGTANPNVSSKGTLHYLSATTGSAAVVTTTASSTVDILTPMTVTNSNPLDPVANNSTWYQSGKLSYLFSGVTTTTVNGVKENANNSASNSFIYPNPASNSAVLAIDLKDNSNVDITVLNAIGQVVKINKAQGQVGQNKINIDLNGLSTGIYMVNVKVGNATSTKKLVIQ